MSTPPTGPRRSRLTAAGLIAVALFLLLVARCWHPIYGLTSLLQVSTVADRARIDAFYAYPVYQHPGTRQYDGAYYAQLAYHPLLRSPELAPAMDNFPYRARRILAPALAWALAAGRPAAIANAYALLNVLAWLALAWLLWGLLPVRDGRSWLAWSGVLFSAGALASVRLALTDLVALAFLAGAMRAGEQNRPGPGAGWLAAAALGRETMLAALPALAAPPWCSWANLRRALVAVLPLLAWIAYVRWQAGPDRATGGNFNWPLLSWAEKGRAAVLALRHAPQPGLAWANLLALLGLTVQAAFFLRPRVAGAWWRLGAANAGLMLVLGPAVWAGFPGAALRVLLPLTLAFNVLACRRRASWAWLVAGNLTILAGLLSLGEAPDGSDELATVRWRGGAGIAHAGPGWYNREHTWHHAWWWSGGRGTVRVDAWPRRDGRLQLAFVLRSLAPRTIVIRQNGRECWRGVVGQERRPVTVAFDVSSGQAELEFSSPTPGMPENGAPNGRALAFAIYDPRLIAP